MADRPFPEALEQPAYQKTPEYQAQYWAAYNKAVQADINEQSSDLKKWKEATSKDAAYLTKRQQQITALTASIDALTKTLLPTDSHAPPVVTESASVSVEPDKAGPLPVEQGLSTKDIAHAFDGVNGWSVDRWTKNLSAAKWLHPARIALGGAGGASSVWSPVMLAQLMHDSTKGEREKEKLMKVFNSRFNRNPALGLWRDAFNDYFATHCATD